MALKASTFIIVLSTMLLCTTTISAFNITRLLNNHPDFSTFNDLLTQTGVAAEINRHRTITVLVIANSGMGKITNKAQNTIKYILATHVLLDYYDTLKLADVSSKGVVSTNLFQSTGIATDRQGQTNVTNAGGEVVFGSAVKGAQLDARMVKSIAAQPFNISVIQISTPIMTPGLEQAAPPSDSPKASPPVAAAPPPKKANNTEAPAPAADADAPADDEADAPISEGPAAANGPSPSPAPADDEDEADHEPSAKLAPAPKSGTAQLTVGSAFVTTFMGLLALSL